MRRIRIMQKCDNTRFGTRRPPATSNWSCALFFFAALLSTLAGCSKDASLEEIEPVDTTGQENETVPFDINNVNDTYAALAPLSNSSKWGPYNVHDPSIIKAGDYFYCYSTDAAYGTAVPPGIQVRKSKDLIDWKFVGWALTSSPKQGTDFIRNNGGVPFNSFWAPYIMKAGNEFRLYYSLSSSTPRLSVIGLLTATSPEGPWTERGVVVGSLNDGTVQTNAIDPTVIADQSGQYFMYYGSAWDGIYILKLNPETGLAAVAGDKGKRIAQRGFTGDAINGNIEAPEIIYNAALQKYFLFIAYDWLETKYNVRVGRGDRPEGPFYDYNGIDMNLDADDKPMILAPYQFKNHGGWQGTSHVSVFQDGEDFFLAHQGRPGIDKYFMVLHVRKVFWTASGWPVVSPQRYAGVEQHPIPAEELQGTWEKVVLNYRIVPGYAAEQLNPDFQLATHLVLHSDGTLDNNAGGWSYNAPWLTMSWNDGVTDEVLVERGRDWENRRAALLFTGLNNERTAVWGKK